MGERGRSNVDRNTSCKHRQKDVRKYVRLSVYLQGGTAVLSGTDPLTQTSKEGPSLTLNILDRGGVRKKH